MDMSAALALVCFISSNPSPQHWLVSGRVEAVARLDALAAKQSDVRLVAHAEDRDVAFSRYELGANPSNVTMYRMLNFADREGMVSSRFQHIVPSCPDGQRSQVGDKRSDLSVALIGPAAAVAKLGGYFGGVTRMVQLENGQTGVGIALRLVDRDGYDALLRRAASAMLDGVDLVLMGPGRGGDVASSIAGAGSSTRRPDPSHRGDE